MSSHLLVQSKSKHLGPKIQDRLNIMIVVYTKACRVKSLFVDSYKITNAMATSMLTMGDTIGTEQRRQSAQFHVILVSVRKVTCGLRFRNPLILLTAVQKVRFGVSVK